MSLVAKKLFYRPRAHQRETDRNIHLWLLVLMPEIHIYY